MKWLITAFEPFAGAKTNSSLISIQELAQAKWDQQVDFLYPIPVSFQESWTTLQKKLVFSQYDGVVALGQAESRKKISLERVALNWIDATIPDNSGVTLKNKKIESGPVARWCNIPWENFEIPQNCELSYSAGTFVCNHLMYHLTEWGTEKNIYTGFIHIPLIQGQEKDFPQIQLNPLADISLSLKKIFEFLFQLPQIK